MSVCITMETMGEKPTKAEKPSDILARIRRNREENEALRAELVEHPDLLIEATKDLEGVDKKIDKQKTVMEKLNIERRNAAEVVAMLTVGKVTKGKRAPSGTGKQKIANQYLHSLGVGATVTGKQVAEASNMFGGAAGAYLKRLLDSGYVTQEAPRMPYVIVNLPEL